MINSIRECDDYGCNDKPQENYRKIMLPFENWIIIMVALWKTSCWYRLFLPIWWAVLDWLIFRIYKICIIGRNVSISDQRCPCGFTIFADSFMAYVECRWLLFYLFFQRCFTVCRTLASPANDSNFKKTLSVAYWQTHKINSTKT